MTPQLDRFLVGLFFISLGLLLLYTVKLLERETAEEIEEYRREFERNPKRLMLWDFVIASVGNFGPRILRLILFPLIPWMLIIPGAILMTDAMILMYWPN